MLVAVVLFLCNGRQIIVRF